MSFTMVRRRIVAGVAGLCVCLSAVVLSAPPSHTSAGTGAAAVGEPCPPPSVPGQCGSTSLAPVEHRPAATQAAGGQHVVINFDDLPRGGITGVVVTNQYPSATFSSNGGVNYVTTQPSYYGSPPNFICTGRYGAIDCQQDTIIDFRGPVDGLTFNAMGVNDTGQVALIDVYQHGALTATVPVIGHASSYAPELQDLSQYNGITRIQIRNITDSAGIGWDDFSFYESGFTVHGSIKVRDVTADPNSDQAGGSPALAAQCATTRGQIYFQAYRAEGVALVGAIYSAGSPHGAFLLTHFLAGSGTPEDFADGSPLSGEVKLSARFQALDQAVQAEAKAKLDAGATDVPVASSLKTVDFNIGTGQINPDLYLAFGGTQGLDVSGSGSKTNGRYQGTITYVIHDTYGFSTKAKFLGAGPNMHYLQTVCGAPFYAGGARWYPDSVTATVPFDQPAS